MRTSYGFLGTGGPLSADLDLVAHVILGVILIAGAVLARRGHYTAHKYLQSSIVLLNLPLIAMIMLPSFGDQVEPALPGDLNMAYYAVATAHAAVGLAAQLLAIYIIAVAGTRLVPSRLRIDSYKAWMRTLLVLWWAVVLLGIGTYYLWYVGLA
jgi:uncharacterized membrane protein YozB (DUF420 family)